MTPARWRLLEGGILAAVAVACLAFQAWLPTTHVAEADYRAVAQVLEREAQAGDAVLLAPWWTERARQYLPAGLEVVGYQGSDADDLARAPRVWVLAEPDLPRAGLDRFQAAFGPGREALGPERRFGRLSLRLYRNGRHRPLAFSSDQLARAEVYLEQPGGARTPCTPDGQGFRCPGRVVAVEWHEVRYQPLRCLRLDPPGGDDRLVVDWSQVPPAARLRLRAGYVGELATYQADVTDSTLGLEVNGELATLLVPKGVERLHSLERGAVPAGARVRLWAQAANPRARQLCVVLDAFQGP